MCRKLLQINSVAEILNVSEERAYALAREGMLPHVRLGRQIRVDSQILEEFIRGGGKALPGGWKRES